MLFKNNNIFPIQFHHLENNFTPNRPPVISGPPPLWRPRFECWEVEINLKMKKMKIIHVFEQSKYLINIFHLVSTSTFTDKKILIKIKYKFKLVAIISSN